MTPVEAAARDQRAAAHLLELARNGQRVLHLSPNRSAARTAQDAVARRAGADPRSGDLLRRTNGCEAYLHRPTGGFIRFVSLDDHAQPASVDLVAIAPDVDLTGTTLTALAAAAQPAGYLRTVGQL